MSGLGGVHEPGVIRELSAQWRSAATSGEGNRVGPDTEVFRLLANGVVFHELSYDGLREAGVGLIGTLMLPRLSAYVMADHYYYWAWAAELLVGHESTYRASADYEISDLASCAFRVAIRPPSGQAPSFMVPMTTMLPYLAFPLLEAVTRRACSEYVKLTGEVIKAFPRKGQMYKVGKFCSSIEDLLKMLVNTVAADRLKADIEAALQVIEEVGQPEGEQGKSGYSILYNWRNSSLHGETSMHTIGYTVLSLAILIALDGIRDLYPEHQARAKHYVRREQEMGYPGGGPWSYYPPFRLS